MIYELVHFLSKFVVIYLDGIFIHHYHIAHHQLHDHILILSIHCHIHAIDKPSHYDIILHRGCIDHIYNTFVCTMIAFPPMNALHLILDQLDKLHALCHDQSCRTDSFLHDGHFVCANHCISKCRLCLLFLHVYHSGDTLEYLDCAMLSTPSNYKSVHDIRLHGDEDHDPRSDLSQGGGGDDAEHPTFIPKYTLTTLQDPREHKMRPQLDTIGHKVNSLLSEPSLSTCETWLLPPTCVLCMIRYLEESHGATTSNGRASEDAKYKDQEKKLPEATAAGRPTTPRLRTTGPLRTTVPATTEQNLWTSKEPRTSRNPRASGRPAPHGRPDPGCVQLWAESHVPLHCRISGSGRPSRFEHWGARRDLALYLPAPHRIAMN